MDYTKQLNKFMSLRDIEDIKDMCNFTRQDILKCRTIGKKKLNGIIEVLKNYGIKLKGEIVERPLLVITSGPTVIYKYNYIVNGNKITITLDDYEKKMLFNID